jgi:hypothetical protein
MLDQPRSISAQWEIEPSCAGNTLPFLLIPLFLLFIYDKDFVPSCRLIELPR